MKRDCLGREDFLITAKTAAKGFNDDQDLIQKATLPIQLPPSNLAFASCYSATTQNTETMFERGFGCRVGFLPLETSR